MNRDAIRFLWSSAFLRGLFIIVMLFCGCSDKNSLESGDSSVAKTNSSKVIRNDRKKRAAKKKKSPYGVDRLPPTTSIIIVDGTNITQKQYADWLDVKSRMGLLREGKKIDLNNLAEERERIRARVPGELIRFALIRHYALTNDIVPTASQLKSSERQLIQNVDKKLKTIDQVAKKIGGTNTQMLPEIIYLDALDEACLERNATNDIHRITDAEVDLQIERIKKWNETAKQKDQESYDKARLAKKEILSGESFENVTKKYSEVSADDGQEWDSVELDEFDADNPLVKWLISAKPGDVSDPMEVDEVIAIFGLKRVYDGEAPEGETPKKQYELVRCAFHAYERIEGVDDREELRKGMLRERRAEVFRALGEKLIGASTIEFPVGEDIFSVGHSHKHREKGTGKPKEKNQKEKHPTE